MTTETKFTVGEYKTRAGSEAKVLFTPNRNGTLIGARKFGDSWIAEMWFANGQAKAGEQSPHDLMPPLREFWRVEGAGDFSSLESAEEFVKLRPREKQLEITKYREVRDDQA